MTRMILLSCLLASCALDDKRSERAASSAAPPGGPARAESKFVTRSFPADGITKVVFRGADAQEARVGVSAGRAIEVSGVPKGGAGGYKSPDPAWKETPPTEWGLDFKSQRFGTTLVISTVNEVEHLHHRYRIGSLQIAAPGNVEVVREPRVLNGEGAADLSAP